jgi:hypothetical protein
MGVVGFRNHAEKRKREERVESEESRYSSTRALGRARCVDAVRASRGAVVGPVAAFVGGAPIAYARASSASLSTVFQLRAVPRVASFDSIRFEVKRDVPMPSG